MAASNSEIVRFVLSHVEAWTKLRRQFYEPQWEEMIENFFVLPYAEGGRRGTQDTYDEYSRGKSTWGDEFTLKSPESRKAVDTFVSFIMNSAFPQGNEYVSAKRVGPEDALAADTMSRLVRHALTREGQRRVIQGAVQEATYLGTSILHLGWRFEERPRRFRDLADIDDAGLPVFGNELGLDAHVDDPQLTNIDPFDFFPFVGKHSLHQTPGAAHRFTMLSFEALKKASDGTYKQSAVDDAIAKKMASGGKSQRDRDKASFKQGQLPDPSHEMHPAFTELEGFEYNGEVPWKPTDAPHRWRTITIIEGVVVRNEPWQGDIFRVPYYDFTFRPVSNRLYGASLIESVRYVQSYLDFNLTQGAKVIKRMVDPPITFNAQDRFLDPARLELWDGPIASDDPASIGTLDYNPRIDLAFAQQQQLTSMFQDQTGVSDALSRPSLPNRISQFQAQQTFQFILNRPENDLRYFEEACLPPLGRGVAGLYLEEFKQSDDPDGEIALRVGNATKVAPIEDIDADWDVEFVGSRKTKTEAEKHQGTIELLQFSQVPQVQTFIPWQPIIARLLERADLPFEYEQIAAFDTVRDNASVALALGGRAQPGNGNGQGFDINRASSFTQGEGVGGFAQ